MSARASRRGKLRSFSKWCWNNGTLMCKKVRPTQDVCTFHNAHHELGVGQSPKRETCSCKGKNTGSIRDFELGKDFGYLTPKTWSRKWKLINWTWSILRTSDLWKAMLCKWKIKPQSGRKYFPITYLMKDLYPKHTDASQNATGKETNNWENIWTEVWPKKICVCVHAQSCPTLWARGL